VEDAIIMSAALDDGYLPLRFAAPDFEGEPEVARLTNQQQITHEQIIGAIGRLEGLVEAEAEARREFRNDIGSRFQSLDQRIGNLGLEVQQFRMQTANQARPDGVIHAVLLLFERQPLLAVVIAGTLLALGSGGVVAIWEAFQK
jgi:hypothetical protein